MPKGKIIASTFHQETFVIEDLESTHFGLLIVTMNGGEVDKILPFSADFEPSVGVEYSYIRKLLGARLINPQGLE